MFATYTSNKLDPFARFHSSFQSREVLWHSLSNKLTATFCDPEKGEGEQNDTGRSEWENWQGNRKTKKEDHETPAKFTRNIQDWRRKKKQEKDTNLSWRMGRKPGRQKPAWQKKDIMTNSGELRPALYAAPASLLAVTALLVGSRTWTRLTLTGLRADDG